MFSIRDTGSGIPDQLRTRLFDQYVTTKGARGRGQGLPIVASILNKIGGALWIDSTHGVGTIMTVAWPVSTLIPRQDSDGNVDDSVRIELNGLHIMIVDDNIDVADVLSDILESKEAVAVAMSDPAEAQAILLNATRFQRRRKLI